MKQTDSHNVRRFYLVLIACYVLLVVVYVAGRFAWAGLDGDALNLTRLSRNVYSEATLTPTRGAYPYGYAYSAMNTFLAHVSGAPIETLQTLVQPFLVVLLIPVAYGAFRGLTGAPEAALLAVVLLFVQPEFLFEALRSSHAKVTWLLALLMLLALTRSLRPARSPYAFAVWVLLFYLAAFGLIASNAFFATNYILSIAIAFLGTRLLARLRGNPPWITPQMGRLWLVALSCFILAVVYIFYVYPPAMQSFLTLKTTVDRVSAVILGAGPTTVNPYGYVGAVWISTPVYLLLSSANWIVLALSFSMWLRHGWMLVVRRQALPQHTLLLLLLYTAFASLLALAVGLDVAGTLSANLQVRLFPHLMIFGVPLASEALVGVMRWARARRPLVRSAAAAALAVALALLSLASVLKLTNEPLFSNWWAFYSPGERHAVEWVMPHLRAAGIWVGSDKRLATLALAYGDWPAQQVTVERGWAPQQSRYLLLTAISEGRATRLQAIMPDTQPYQRIYDDGTTWLYHRRPQTPYQR